MATILLVENDEIVLNQIEELLNAKISSMLIFKGAKWDGSI